MVIARTKILSPLRDTYWLTAVRPLSVRRRHTDRRFVVETDCQLLHKFVKLAFILIIRGTRLGK